MKYSGRYKDCAFIRKNTSSVRRGPVPVAADHVSGGEMRDSVCGESLQHHLDVDAKHVLIQLVHPSDHAGRRFYKRKGVVLAILREQAFESLQVL